MSTLLLLLPAAMAYESPEQGVVFHDETNLYEAVEYDSGWIPGGSPVAIAFRITADGGAYVDMEGTSWLEWPPALTQGFEAMEEGGWMALDTTLTASVDMNIDIFGYQNEFPLVSDSTGFYGEGTFTPFLLPDGEVTSVIAYGEGESDELFNVSYAIVSGVEVYLTTDIRTDATAELSGLRITTGEEIIDIADGVAIHEVPTGGALDISAIFTGYYEAALDLVFIPSFGVCISPFGCYDVASFELPVNLASAAFEEDFDSININHPLPQVDVEVTDHDFGTVEVGQIATLQLEVGSFGDLPIEGVAGILGAGEFTVFPGDIYAQGDTVDGLTVTFAPTFEGTQEAELVLTTSDPLYPEIRVTLTGTGWVDEKIDTIPAEVGCQCSSSQAPGAGALAWLGGLLGLALVRRRRR
ncbi:MAG: MYXO-CTERM sorting domain-containing protein [Alphaproteobacteria bacterium]|nr:MYXO-CTERM sorting domain-containing protein [Alphaproteobacteria bacterium]MCB9791491.1 MYXO-CTERM sorting domain-containing protein [Alphaproteobacteria bacterium]